MVERGATEIIGRNKFSVIRVFISFELLSPSPPRDESVKKGVGTCAGVNLAPNELYLVMICSVGTGRAKEGGESPSRTLC